MHMHDAGFRIATKDLSGLAKHVSNIEKQRRLRQSERRSLIIGFRCIIEEEVKASPHQYNRGRCDTWQRRPTIKIVSPTTPYCSGCDYTQCDYYNESSPDEMRSIRVYL